MSLVDLVSRLSRTHVETIKVTDRVTGMPEKIKHIRQPLLTELEECTGGIIGGRGGGQAGSKVIIHAESIELQGEIRGELIKDMQRMRQHVTYGTLAQILRVWHREWKQTATPAEEVPWVEVLADWEHRIRAIIEPPKSMPVKQEPCMLCGETRIMDGEDSVIALWIEWSEDDPERTARLVCKACGPIVQEGGTKLIAAALNIEKDAL